VGLKLEEQNLNERREKVKTLIQEENESHQPFNNDSHENHESLVVDFLQILRERIRTLAFLRGTNVFMIVDQELEEERRVRNKDQEKETGEKTEKDLRNNLKFLERKVTRLSLNLKKRKKK